MRLAWRELRARGGRTVGLAVAVFVAATGFVVLTASSDASRLETVGVVQADARTTYDILVRPAEARTVVEKEQRLIQPGFMGGTLGGISERQWHLIADLPGIEVAAPVVVVGVVTPVAVLHQDLTRLASRDRDTTLRLVKRWTLADGTVRGAKPDYVLTTPAAVGAAPQPAAAAYDCSEADARHYYVPPGRTADRAPSTKLCYFSRVRRVLTYQPFSFPIVIIGVDPAAETALVGLDHASSAAAVQRLAAGLRDADQVPVLTSTATPAQARLDVEVQRLPSAASGLMTGGRNLRRLGALAGTTVRNRTFDADHAYAAMLRQLAQDRTGGGYVQRYLTVSQPRFEESPDGALRAVPVARQDLRTLFRFVSTSSIAPAGTDLTPFRTMRVHEYHGDQPLATGGTTLVPVGSFDADRLVGLDDATAQILAGYATAPTVGADARSRALLGQRPVGGSTNLAALVQAPPAMVTDLTSSRKLTGSFFGSPFRAKPISAIRVRVDGVTGVDELSRERVRLAAQLITSRTGLAVDVTVGASYVEQTIVQPSTTEGQPELTLRQAWVKLGVATAVLEALDRKSLVLFLLVLLVSGLSIANSAIASVRSRRTQLGVLACLGWTRGDLLRLVLTELGIVATVAGALAVPAALALGAAAGTPVAWSRAGLAVPLAVGLTLLAGSGPAFLAARARPLDALHPTVSTGRRVRRVGGLLSFAVANLTRVRSRTLLAVAGLTVAATVSTLLLAVALGFQGAVVGTALGDIVAVQVRGADYAAAAATLGLAALGVANLTYLNLRDRGTEIATLRALGWTDRDLRGALLREAGLVGLAGGVLGAALGYAGAWALIGDLPVAVVVGAVGAALLVGATAVVASLLALALLDRVPTLELLSE